MIGWSTTSDDTTLVGFDGFGLKTTGARFAGFWPQNLGEDIGVAHGIIKELASRQSFFMKGLWSSSLHNLTWTISPLRLSGSEKISRGIL